MAAKNNTHKAAATASKVHGEWAGRGSSERHQMNRLMAAYSHGDMVTELRWAVVAQCRGFEVFGMAGCLECCGGLMSIFWV